MGYFDQFWGDYDDCVDSYLQYRMCEDTYDDMEELDDKGDIGDVADDISLDLNDKITHVYGEKDSLCRVKLLLDIECDHPGYTLNDEDEKYIKDKLQDDLSMMGIWLYKYIEQLRNDSRIYIYYGVLLEHINRILYYLGDNQYHVGNEVIVPIGKDNAKVKGRIVLIGQSVSQYAPYPVEKMKTIIKKI